MVRPDVRSLTLDQRAQLDVVMSPRHGSFDQLACQVTLVSGEVLDRVYIANVGVRWTSRTGHRARFPATWSTWFQLKAQVHFLTTDQDQPSRVRRMHGASTQMYWWHRQAVGDCSSAVRANWFCIRLPCAQREVSTLGSSRHQCRKGFDSFRDERYMSQRAHARAVSQRDVGTRTGRHKRTRRSQG
jgi:hypothetical protein